MNSPNVDVDGRSDPADRSLDEVFEALSNPRRRHALRCLADRRQSIALADLAEDVVTRENEGPFTEIAKEEVKAVYTSLYHTHLPKLREAGVVAYDQERDLVRATDAADRTHRILSCARDEWDTQ